ncbi:MAG: hypothetical protein CMN93_07720 [Synechococcus sp. CPC35]|nr:hypothetical protein [Synechococcus sp. CPC35]
MLVSLLCGDVLSDIVAKVDYADVLALRLTSHVLLDAVAQHLEAHYGRAFADYVSRLHYAPRGLAARFWLLRYACQCRAEEEDGGGGLSRMVKYMESLRCAKCGAHVVKVGGCDACRPRPVERLSFPAQRVVAEPVERPRFPVQRVVVGPLVAGAVVSTVLAASTHVMRRCAVACRP